MAKLDWLNHQWIMTLSDDEHERLVGERLPAGTPAPAVRALAAGSSCCSSATATVPLLAAAVLKRPSLDSQDAPGGGSPPVSASSFSPRCGAARTSPYLSPGEARELLAEYRRLGEERLGLSPRELLMPLRQALTGHEHGPELHYVLAAVAADETLRACLGSPPPLPATDTATDAGAPTAAIDATETVPGAAPPPATNEGDRR